MQAILNRNTAKKYTYSLLHYSWYTLVSEYIQVRIKMENVFHTVLWLSKSKL